MPTIEQARGWYVHSDPVHDFDHILRVYNMAERLGPLEGADMTHPARGSPAARRRGHHARQRRAQAVTTWPRRISPSAC